MKEELLGLIKKAMLSKNAVQLRTLRLIKTEFGEFEKAKDAKVLTPEAEIGIINKMVKERNDSIEKYTEAGRLDLVQQEQDEKDFLMTFLPTQMSDGLILQKIKELMFPSIVAVLVPSVPLTVNSTLTTYPVGLGIVYI